MLRGRGRLEKGLSSFTHVPSPDPAFTCGRAASAPRSWVYRQVLAPTLALLKAGLSPEKLALSVSLGTTFDLVPTFGIASVVSTATALRRSLTWQPLCCWLGGGVADCRPGPHVSNRILADSIHQNAEKTACNYRPPRAACSSVR
jgi:hypothetical protein